MAINEVYTDADHLSLPVPSGKKSGDPVRVGGLNGVCETDRADSSQDPSYVNGSYNAGPWGGGNPDGYATVFLKGAYRFTVTGATTPGTPVYITSTGVLNVTATDNSLFGHALESKTAAAGPCTVRIAN